MPLQSFPIIALVGPDATGKSTLAAKLGELYNYQYQHATYRFKDKMDLYHLAYLDLALRKSVNGPVVMDRWWPCEHAYAEVFRQGPSSPSYQWPYYGQMLDRVALKHGVLYVFCLPRDKGRYLAHFDRTRRQRPEMFDSVSAVYDQYERLLSGLKGHPNLIRYDIFDDAKPFYSELNSLAWRSFVSATSGADFAAGIDDRRFAGNLNARLLLIGDRSNKRTRRTSYPFIAGHSCSPWITRALSNLGVKEADVAWVNLHDERGRVQWTKVELDAFYHMTFVAMGASAQASLTKMGYRFERVPHPQYYTRFHHHVTRPERLVKLFEDHGLFSTPAKVIYDPLREYA